MKKTLPDTLWLRVVPTLLILVLLFFVLLHLFRVEKELALQKTTLELAHQERIRMQTFTEKIYQMVVSALQSKDSTQQEIARALVTSMNNDPVREQLLSVMSESPLTAASVKRRINHVLTIESTFDCEESEVPQITDPKASEDWKRWNYDVFFLEDRESDSLLSHAIVRKLIDNGYEGRIRIRMLPTSVNMRTGYHVNAPEVRYNTWEKRGAKEVKALLDDFSATKEIGFSLHTIAMNTPNYISIFVVKK